MRVADETGTYQMMKDVLPQTHMIDIRIRLNGKYYWFEGDFLKRVFRGLQFVQSKENRDIKPNLKDHEEVDK